MWPEPMVQFGWLVQSLFRPIYQFVTVLMHMFNMRFISWSAERTDHNL